MHKRSKTPAIGIKIAMIRDFSSIPVIFSGAVVEFDEASELDDT